MNRTGVGLLFASLLLSAFPAGAELQSATVRIYGMD
jgi:hypothetical protein